MGGGETGGEYSCYMQAEGELKIELAAILQ